MNRILLLALTLCLFLTLAPATAMPLLDSDQAAATPNVTDVSPLLKEGANGKLSTDLLQLIDQAARLPGQSRATIVRSLRNMDAYRGLPGTDGSGNEEVYVYISLQASSPTALVEPFVQRVVSRDEAHGLVSAMVAPEQLLTLASQPFVRSVKPVTPPQTNIGSSMTEGDSLLNADQFRAQLGYSGAGMKIGIISDGVDHWTTARDTGDLPSDFHVLSNTQGGDEGTAMAEIVHDIAPNASLYFHDYCDDQIQFNQAITELADAGCQVIVDDIYWWGEPYFEDGLIGQHVNQLVQSRNIVYVTSAGNYAKGHYQGQFYARGGSVTDWHDFSNGSNATFRSLSFSVPPGDRVVVILQWDDPFTKSGNDYDLYVTDYSTGEYRGTSLQVQNGDDEPSEGLIVENTGTSTHRYAVWVKKNAGAESRTLEVYLFPGGKSTIDSYNIVATDSIFGHMMATEAISVAGAPVTTPNILYPYSSRGPVTIRWPMPGTRQKPDITCPTGNLISGAGDFGSKDGDQYRFWGTSASAPHVAALLALVWSGRPGATNDEVRAALLDTAQDRGSTGYDYSWGHGWPDALAFATRLGVGLGGVKLVPGAAGVPRDLDANGRFEDVNGNGRKDFADVVLYFNQMSWISANEPVTAFDYNGNDRIDFADVVWLFNNL